MIRAFSNACLSSASVYASPVAAHNRCQLARPPAAACKSRIDPLELVELGEHYARASGYPIQYQWTLLAGINDSREEIERIADWLSGKYAMMNLIPFNAIEGSSFQRPGRNTLPN